MSRLHLRFLTFDELTRVQWRRLDGNLLQEALVTPAMCVWLLLDEWGVRGDYDVYARANEGEWRLIYRVRPQDGGGLIVDWVQP